MDPREALSKAVGPTEIGSDWINNPAANADAYRGANNILSPSAEATLTQAEMKFLVDTMVDESALLKEVRKVVMNRPRVEIPRMFIDDAGTGLHSNDPGGHPESTEGDQIAPEYNTIVLTSSKLVLPWTVTEEFLEDNPEGGAAEQTIARLMAIRAANDLERLALMGSDGTIGVGVASAPLLHANNGYITIATAPASQSAVLAENGANFTTDTLNRMLRALPTKYRGNPRNLRFFVGPNIWSDYTDAWASRMGSEADRFLAQGGDLMYKGVPLRMIPFMPENRDDSTLGNNDEAVILLTNPDNLVWGVQREMKLRKTMEGRTAINKDQRYYALHIRCDFQIQNTEAVAIATGVAPRVP